MKEGSIVYYIEENYIYEGKVMDIEVRQGRTFFSIEGYGSCEGACRICEDQVGKWIFTNKQDAQIYIKSLQSRLHEE